MGEVRGRIHRLLRGNTVATGTPLQAPESKSASAYPARTFARLPLRAPLVRSCPGFLQEGEGRKLKRQLKALERDVASEVQNGQEGNKGAEVKSGSVTLAIFKSRNSLKFLKKPVEGGSPSDSPEFENRYYDSFVDSNYEGMRDA